MEGEDDEEIAPRPGRKAKRKRMRPQGAANYYALLPVILAACMALVGFGYSWSLIDQSVPTVQTELRSTRA